MSFTDPGLSGSRVPKGGTVETTTMLEIASHTEQNIPTLLLLSQARLRPCIFAGPFFKQPPEQALVFLHQVSQV